MTTKPHLDFWVWLGIIAIVAACFCVNTCSGAECVNGQCQTAPAIIKGPLGGLRIKEVVPLVPAKLTVRYGWYTQAAFQPTPYRGVAGEVTSRVRRSSWYTYPDIGTTTHETCHVLNSNVRNALYRGVNQEAAYMPGGFVILLPGTGLSLNEYAKRSHGLFVWGQGPRDAIAMIDEYSTYLCGMAARIENPTMTDSLPSGDYKRGMWLESDLRDLRKVLADREWPFVKQLDELLAYGHAKYEAYRKRLP